MSIIQIKQPVIKIELVDEIVISSRPAMITIWNGNDIYDRYWAVIERAKGADGGWYNIVVFKPVEEGERKETE